MLKNIRCDKKAGAGAPAFLGGLLFLVSAQRRSFSKFPAGDQCADHADTEQC
jgi:hypothetical protein